MNGYIYLRGHPSYDIDEVYKMGKTLNIPERDSTYATSELRRGKFILVFEVPYEDTGNIEKLLQYRFNEFNVKYDAGSEFFKKEISELIEPYLKRLKIKYKLLTEQEIDELVRCRDKQYIPRDYQTIIINKSISYFKHNDRGVLVLICGIGKTLISLWIAQGLNSNTIIIGVPNILLLKQWVEVITVLNRNVPYLIVSEGITVKNIIFFLKKHWEKCIVITTYSSAYKVHKATQECNFNFSMKLLDEAHHLTTKNMELAHTKNSYIHMLDIKSDKQLSLTATLKLLERDGYDVSDDKPNHIVSEDDYHDIVSNDDIDHFGEIIDRKNLLWAIRNSFSCDYVLQTIITGEEQLEKYSKQFNFVDKKEMRLCLSAFASLKSISEGHSHHLLMFSNSTENSTKLIQFIEMFIEKDIFVIPGLYYSPYHSKMKSKERLKSMESFNVARCGILSSVNCLCEGVDMPLLDGVVITENMTSNIRIVQSVLRSCRKDINDVNKIAKIIIPLLNEEFLSEKPDFKMVREIINQLGLEDEMVTQKIKVFRIDIDEGHKPREKKEKKSNDELGEYDDELTQVLRLKTVERSSLGTTYEKAKKIILSSHIIIENKKSYRDLCERDNRLPKEPEEAFRGKFSSWTDYLSIDRNKYDDLKTCKEKVAKYLSEVDRSKLLDLSKVCENLCIRDKLFPPYGLWVDFYKVNQLTDIIETTIYSKKKKI